MNKHISAEEILQIAITIEENGQEFYSMALKSISNPAMRKQIESLAGWEDTHVAELKKMLAGVVETSDEYPMFLSPEEDSSLYIKAIGDQHIFVQDGSIDELVKSCNDIEALLRLALRFERDSVKFYKSVAEQANSTETKEVLLSIMQEELFHVAQVEKLIDIELES